MPDEIEKQTAFEAILDNVKGSRGGGGWDITLAVTEDQVLGVMKTMPFRSRKVQVAIVLLPEA